MDCTPSALAEASKCLCLDDKTIAKVEVCLLCSWATGQPPAATQYLMNEDEIYITDADGNKIVITN